MGLKHKGVAIVACIILVVILWNVAIVVVNNGIAKQLEDRLRAVPLPPQSQLLESTSIAGKMEGNGNGMQYFGILLLESDLTEEEIEAHYRERTMEKYDVMVFLQESDEVFPYHGERFERYREEAICYQVRLCEYSVVGCESSLWESILNTDLRGH